MPSIPCKCSLPMSIPRCHADATKIHCGEKMPINRHTDDWMYIVRRRRNGSILLSPVLLLLLRCGWYSLFDVSSITWPLLPSAATASKKNCLNGIIFIIINISFNKRQKIGGWRKKNENNRRQYGFSNQNIVDRRQDEISAHPRQPAFFTLTFLLPFHNSFLFVFPLTPLCPFPPFSRLQVFIVWK